MIERGLDLPAFRVVKLVAIALLVQSFGTIVPIAAFGVAMPSLELEIGTTRAMTSLVIGVMLVSLSITSLFAGGMLQKSSVTRAMMLGALVSTVGYLLAAVATSIYQFLAIYGLLIGPGACLMGPLTVSTLIGQRVTERRTQMLALANVPVFLLVAQPIAAQILLRGGRVALFVALAGLVAALIPLVYLVRDRAGVRPAPAQGRTAEAEPAAVRSDSADRLMTSRALTATPRFWFLSMGVGALTGIGAAYLTHAAAIATTKNFGVEAASTLLSFYGLGALIGAVAFGWLADRIGPLLGLTLNTLLQSCSWIGLALVDSLSGAWFCSVLIGMGMGSLVALHSSAINQLFGLPNFPRVMGMSYFFKLPFMLGANPLAGLLFDITHSYTYTLICFAALIGMAGVTFIVMKLTIKEKVRYGLPV